MVISPSLHFVHITPTITTVSLDDTHEGLFFLQIPSEAQAGAFELKRVYLGLKSTKLTSHLRHVLLTCNDKKLFRVRFLPPLPHCGLDSPSLESESETWVNSREVCSLQLLTRLPGSGLNHKRSACSRYSPPPHGCSSLHRKLVFFLFSPPCGGSWAKSQEVSVLQTSDIRSLALNWQAQAWTVQM
jgi:hypothetical protein